MKEADTSAPKTAEVVLDPGRRRMILIAMCAALMAVIASVTGLNVAQQDLALEFGASQGTILWIINAYTLALAALLMPIGAIGDRWGRVPVLLTGLVVFTGASVLGAVAGSATMMIVSRTVAGVGAAMIMPVTLSVITSSFPEEHRGQAIGIWAGVAGAGGMIGMFVASAMVDLVTWRWLFALPVALAVAGLYLVVRYVPNSSEDSEHAFDVGGSVLSLLAIGGLVLGIHEGPEKGWMDPLAIGPLVVGVVAVAAFVWWELRHPEPLLDVRSFADRRLAAGSVTLLSLFAVISGVFIVLFPFFQAVLGWSALRSASALLPMALVMMPAASLAPRLAKTWGGRRTMLLGIALVAAGLATLAASASVEGGYFSVLPGLLIVGLGAGISMTPSTESIVSSLPADKQGVASALNDTTREVGSAVGVAALGAVLAGGYRDAITPNLAGYPVEVADVASEGIGAAFGAAAELGAEGLHLIDLAQHAFVEGWSQSLWVGVAISAVVFLFILVRGPRQSSRPEQAAQMVAAAEASG